MSPGDRAWTRDAKPEARAGRCIVRQAPVAAMAAVVALATVAGALGGALATAGLGKLMAGDCRIGLGKGHARSKPPSRGSMPTSSR